MMTPSGLFHQITDTTLFLLEESLSRESPSRKNKQEKPPPSPGGGPGAGRRQRARELGHLRPLTADLTGDFDAASRRDYLLRQHRQGDVEDGRMVLWGARVTA